MPNTTRLAVGVLFTLALALAGCDTSQDSSFESTGAPGAEPSQESAAPVDAQRTAWEALDIIDYRIRYEIRNLNGVGGSPGDGTFDVTVRDGFVTDCTISEGFQSEDGSCDLARFGAASLSELPLPIDTLFSRVKAFELARSSAGLDGTDAVTFTVVRYDPTWHFPSTIQYDDPEIADEEYRITVQRFEVASNP